MLVTGDVCGCFKVQILTSVDVKRVACKMEVAERTVQLFSACTETCMKPVFSIPPISQAWVSAHAGLTSTLPAWPGMGN